MQKRRNTKLESEGAEFLVLGNLLLNGIVAHKTYTNMPGYDLIATNPENKSAVTIQVKSRFRTDWDGFIIKNFNSDFVVLVTLNRGYAIKKKIQDDGIKDPDFFIFPIDYVKEIRDPDNKWGKISKSKMIDFEKFENNWVLIKKKLSESQVMVAEN